MDALAAETTQEVILHPEHGWPICGSGIRNKPGEICKQRAGTRTSHKGVGRCWLHNGAPLKTGLHSIYVKHDRDIAERVEELKTDPQLMNGKGHLALVVALCERAVVGMGKEELKDIENARVVSTILGQVQKIIESIHKIEAGYWLSPEKVEQCINLIVANIQRECRSCPKLPTLAAAIESTPMPE